MKNEAINSFSEGLVKDMNELNTPDKALTNCLNGTIITYNGNEYSLQNDMGNDKIGTAFLRNGYVPVGMKEYGGIIYVASYNPETGRGQIGSFPSPQQIFLEDNLEDNKLEGFLKNIFENYNPLVIKNDFYREEISNEELHPGDKFILQFSSEPSDNVLKLIESKVLNLNLAILAGNGQLEYIDSNTLRMYNYTPTAQSFLLPFNNIPALKDILALKDPSYNRYLQIFNSPTSGKLYLVGEYNTFETMSVSHKISRNLKGIESIDTTVTVSVTNNNPNVKLTGVYTYDKGGYKAFSKKDESEPSLIFTFTETLENNSLPTKTIYPASYYGILKRLGYEYGFSALDLINGVDNLSSFSYEVKDGYIDFSYGYNFLSTSGTKVSGIRFSFYDLVTRSQLDLNKKVGYFDMTQDSYLGYWSFSKKLEDIGLTSGKIYICKIDRIIKLDNNAEDIKSYYRTVYTSPLLNTLGYIKKLEVTIPISPNYSIKETSSSCRDILNNKEITLTSQNLKFDEGDSISSYRLKREVTKTYELLSNDNDIYSLPEQIEVNGNNITLSELGLNIVVDTSNVEYSANIIRGDISSSNLSSILTNDTITKSGSKKFTVVLNRSAYSSVFVNQNTAEIVRLEPMYKGGQDNYFLAYNSNSYTIGTMVGSSHGFWANGDWNDDSCNNMPKDQSTNFNSVVRSYISRTTKDIDTVSVGIFRGGGPNIDDGSFRIEETSNGNYGYSDVANSELAPHDNWMMAMMKTNKGNWYLLNLGSPKNSANDNYTRLPYLIQSIFSQILVPVRKPVTSTFKVPDTSTYIETEVDSTITLSAENSKNDNLVSLNISYNNIDYNEIVNSWTFKDNEDSINIGEVNVSVDNISLLLPTFIPRVDKTSSEIKVGNNIMSEGIDVNIVFTEAYSIPNVISDDVNPNKFYLGDVAGWSGYVAKLKTDGGSYVSKDSGNIDLPTSIKNGNNNNLMGTGTSLANLRSYFSLSSSGRSLSDKNTLLINEDSSSYSKSNTLFTNTWVGHTNSVGGPRYANISFHSKIAYRN